MRAAKSAEERVTYRYIRYGLSNNQKSNMKTHGVILSKVKEEVKDEFDLCNALMAFDDGNQSVKQEYYCKEEIDLEWDEKDNNYVEFESTFDRNVHETTVKLETDNEDLPLPIVSKTRRPSKRPNALPKLIKRSCPKCKKISEITISFLYRKKKCTICSTLSLQFQCVKCDKQYTHYDSIRYHVLSKCHPEEHHQCAHCPYKTTIQSQLTKHKKRVHEMNNEPMLKCSKCGKEFKYVYSLNRHSRKSCGLKFPKSFVKCDNCDRKFKDHRYLKGHEKVCGQEVMLACDYCGFESKHKQRLITHLRKRHSE